MTEYQVTVISTIRTEWEAETPEQAKEKAVEWVSEEYGNLTNHSHFIVEEVA